MELDLVRGIIIIFLILAFIVMAVWLWFFADQRQLEAAANMPLDEGFTGSAVSDTAGHKCT